MTRLIGRREFLADRVPFLLGRYPDRPAPTHVINGFLLAAFGEGPAATGIRKLLREPEFGDEVPGLSESISADARALEQFRQMCRIVLDPDEKVYRSMGSPFPLHLGFVSRDPSDDGLGEATWRFVSSASPGAREALRGVLAPATPQDALGELADILTGGFRPTTQVAGTRRGRSGTTSLPGPLGRRFSRNLTELALAPITDPSHSTRSLQIVALTRSIFAAAYLAALRAASFATSNLQEWSALPPMFVLGTIPPGRAGSPEVRLASRSYERVVSAHRMALEELLVEKLRSQRLPRALPARQRVRTLIRGAFPDVHEDVQEEAARVAARAATPSAAGQAIMGDLYPVGHLERGFRSMGSKIGLAGPDRGFGAPRFLLETPVLALIVEVTLGDSESLPYEDWLDRLYEKFGMICGRGRRLEPEAVLHGLERRNLIARAVDANHDALRRRLIQSGMAVEYSDSETEVIRPRVTTNAH